MITNGLRMAALPVFPQSLQPRTPSVCVSTISWQLCLIDQTAPAIDAMFPSCVELRVTTRHETASSLFKDMIDPSAKRRMRKIAVSEYGANVGRKKKSFKESDKETLARVKKEMEKPRLSKSARKDD